MLKCRLLSIGLLLLLLLPGRRGLAQPTSLPPDPAQWAAEVRAFARQDSLTPPPAAPVLFYGSSSIRKWTTLAADFPGQPVLNRGFGGSRFPEANYFFEPLVVRYRPRLVVLYEGDNDLAAGATPQQVYESFRAFERLMRGSKTTHRTPVVFIAIKPSLARWALYPQMQAANNLIRQYIVAHPQHLRFADVGPVMLGPDGRPRPELFEADGLHMTGAGYEIWTRVVGQYLGE